MSIMVVKDIDRKIDPRDVTCCYPECGADPWPQARAPLCWDHMVDAWGQVSLEMSDRTPLGPSRAELHGAVQPKADAPGSVYFVRFGDSVKIGFSRDVARRLKNIPHDEVLATFPGTMRDEARCHALFADLRLKTASGREWFQLDQRILDFIAERAA